MRHSTLMESSRFEIGGGFGAAAAGIGRAHPESEPGTGAPGLRRDEPAGLEFEAVAVRCSFPDSRRPAEAQGSIRCGIKTWHVDPPMSGDHIPENPHLFAVGAA